MKYTYDREGQTRRIINSLYNNIVRYNVVEGSPDTATTFNDTNINFFSLLFALYQTYGEITLTSLEKDGRSTLESFTFILDEFKRLYPIK